MLEVEMKFPVEDFGPVEVRLAEWHAKAEAPQNDADSYFNAPDRDFAKTDEALRIRRIGAANYVTYKGPKIDKHTKTRTEIEVSLAEGDQTAQDFAKLLQHLGYRAVATIEKHRRIFHIQRAGFALEVSLDEVTGVGHFAELEIQAEEQDLDKARAVLGEIARELGLEKSERRSYLEIYLSRHAAHT